jgi:hypothetical protein
MATMAHQVTGNGTALLRASAYPPRPDPPPDDRPRTSLTDLPSEARVWLRQVLGGNWRVHPVTELVNVNHSFLVCRGAMKFFLKITAGEGAFSRAGREAEVLGRLRGLPCPEVVAWHAPYEGLGFLLTTWLDALPARYLDSRATLAPTYLRQLGEILAQLHGQLRSANLPEAKRSAARGPAVGDLERAAYTYLGCRRAQTFAALWEDADAWLRRTPWQLLQGDLQDKNILLSRQGRVYLCDFETAVHGAVAGELSVDRIFLKRDLPEEERARLQQLLLDGYGGDPGLDAAGAARLRLLRMGEMMAWEHGSSLARCCPPTLSGEYCARFDSLLRFL